MPKHGRRILHIDWQWGSLAPTRTSENIEKDLRQLHDQSFAVRGAVWSRSLCRGATTVTYHCHMKFVCVCPCCAQNTLNCNDQNFVAVTSEKEQSK